MTKPSFIFACCSLIAGIALASLPNLQANEVATEGAELGKWTMDYAAAAELAKTKNVPMLLNFTGSDWCGWCKHMDKEVYAKPEWSEYAAKGLVLVTIDFPNDKSIVPEKFVDQNKELAAKFGIPGFPTYVILDSDGETKLGQLGAGPDYTPASFIAEVEHYLRFRQPNIDAKVAELGETKGAEYLAAIEAVKTVEQKMKDWIATGPKSNEENDKKFASFNKAIADAHAKLKTF